MGEPFFKIKEFCRQHGVLVHSSNYALYGDLSQRVMNVLAERAPEMQIYSIDEAFLTYPSSDSCDSIFEICLETRRILKKWVGIPTSLGIGPTKTLAKIAVEHAKKAPQGVFSVSNVELREEILKTFPIKDIWGIGGASQVKLQSLGIHTAWQFREADPLFIRKKMGVVGERILWELRGVSCLPLEQAVPRKNITCSRSFGKTVRDISELGEALSTYIHKACIKLRQQKSYAKALCIYLEAVIDAKNGTRWQENRAVAFDMPTNEAPVMISAAKRCLSQLFSKQLSYKKCGVILLDLVPHSNIVPDLFLGDINPKRQRVVEAMDNINARFGKNSLFYAAMGVDPQWAMRCGRRSDRYTTCWKELATAKA